MIAMLFCITVFSHASFYLNLGESVKSGSYYTFPDAEVFDDNPTDRAYVVRIMFTRAVETGDAIVLPGTLPAGFAQNSNSTEFVRVIDIASGATAEKVQTLLRDIKVSVASGKKGHALMVMLSEESNDANRLMYYSSEKGHWYEYVGEQKQPPGSPGYPYGQPYEWWEAYNRAIDRTFMGMNGYLAVITSAAENEFIFSISSGKMGWIGGTRGDIRTVLDADGIHLTGRPSWNGDGNQSQFLNYWYWACGPEYWGEPEYSIFYNKAKVSDASENQGTSVTYDYAAWGSGQPDNATNAIGSPEGENYLHLGLGGGKGWNDYGVYGLNPSGPSSNQTIVGSIIEYDGYINALTASALVGFESEKNASIGGVPNNGTATNPVQVVYGDEILYKITAVNPSEYNTYVNVIDVLPEGLEVVNISDGGYSYASSYYDEETDSYRSQTEIHWGINVPLEGSKVINYTATPSRLAKNVMKNTAQVISVNRPAEQRIWDGGGLFFSQTDTTYHKGAVAAVKFKAVTGGSLSNAADQEVDYGEHPNAGVLVSKEPGYEFTGWKYPAYTSLKGESKSAANNIMDYTTIDAYGNMELTADFKLIEYNLTYDLKGGAAGSPANPVKYTVVTPTFTLSNPTKAGYEFLGWTDDNDPTPQKTLTIPVGSIGNRNFVANWKLIEYTISYIGNGGTLPTTNPDKYTIESSTITLNPPTRLGYSFINWTITSDESGVTVSPGQTIPTGTYGNLTCTANWSIITYNITYAFGGGADPGNPSTYCVTDLPIALLNTAKTGWSFKGWTGANGSTPQRNLVIPENTVGDLHYDANWTEDDYLIDYDYKGGVAPAIPNPASYKYADLPFNIENEPTRIAYTFDGWTGSNGSSPQTPLNLTSASSGIPGDLSYNANWNPISYTITYDGNGGTEPAANPTTYDVTTPDITLAPSVRAGYTFNGWAIASDAVGVTVPAGVLIAQGTYGNLHCVAQWTKDTYTISYDYAGGVGSTIPNPINYDIEVLPITLNPPTRLGYDFVEWSITSTDPVTIPNGNIIPVSTTGNLTCTAIWSVINYNIIYNYNGGTAPAISNPVSYTVADLPLAIVNQPTKSGHTFVGWTGSNGTVPETAVTVPLNTTGDLTYDAKWSFQFADDTLTNCTPPLKLSSGHDGLGYVWILPDGSSKTTADIQALTSGRYILRTNYGSMTTVDTIYVQYAFEGNIEIKNISKNGYKIGKIQEFIVSLNPSLTNVTYQWTFNGGGTPAASTADTVAVVYNTAGKKRISVKVTVTLGSLICDKTLTLELDIFDKARNFFVDQNAHGEADGSSWQDAYLRVQDALVKATEGDCIWVATGVYTPPAGNSFQLTRDSIEIYGGFGAWEEYLSERNFAANPTVLRGSGSSVIVNSNAGNKARWDGFIVDGGSAIQGGGIFNNKSSLTIANCIIRENTADEGAGIYSSMGNPVFYNVEISGNTAADGAAMYNNSANPKLTNVTISGNRANIGGGLYNVNSNPRVLNSIIWGNKATTRFSNVANDLSDPYYHYSIIGDSQINENWDDNIGFDGGNNLSTGPLFRINGFDEKGNMQAGDYRIGASSIAKDRGLNRYVYDISVRWGTNLQTLSETSYLSVLPYDLAYNERIINERVDIGAYEHGSIIVDPIIMREVQLPYVEGLILNPGPGKHYVRSQSDFVFTVSTVLRNNSLDNLDVKTGNEKRDKEGIKMVKNEDGSVTVTIMRVTEPLMITINGVSPTSTESLEGENVWSYRRNVVVKTEKTSEVRIYDMTGKLFLQQKVDAGETVIPLSQGFFTIQLNDRIYKVIIK